MALIKIGTEINNKNLEIQMTDRIELAMGENPTTGFTWEIDAIDDSILKHDKAEFILDAGGGIGGGGLRTFLFSPVAPGRATVKLKHWRSWEGEPSVNDRLSFIVIIKK